jgi:hypothetical protein
VRPLCGGIRYSRPPSVNLRGEERLDRGGNIEGTNVTARSQDLPVLNQKPLLDEVRDGFFEVQRGSRQRYRGFATSVSSRRAWLEWNTSTTSSFYFQAPGGQVMRIVSTDGL